MAKKKIPKRASKHVCVTKAELKKLISLIEREARKQLKQKSVITAPSIKKNKGIMKILNKMGTCLVCTKNYLNALKLGLRSKSKRRRAKTKK